MKKYIIYTLIIGSISTLFAADADIDMLISHFQVYKDVQMPIAGTIPGVIEVPALYTTYTSGFLVVDQTSHKHIPANTYITWKTNDTENKVLSKEFPKLTDENEDTYSSFAYTPSNHEAHIKLTATHGPVTSSRISLTLDSYVEAPDTVELYAIENGVKRSVIAKRDLSSLDFYFPKTESEEWELVLNYTQPLRIREVKIYDDNKKIETTPQSISLRFLAQPKTNYRIYEDDGRATTTNAISTYKSTNTYTKDPSITHLPPYRMYGDYGMASTTKSFETYEDPSIMYLAQDAIQKVSATKVVINPLYKETDTDGDGIPDVRDNCKSVPNTDQSDENGNTVGDVCEDYDYDGIPNNIDNCSTTPNRDQLDSDGDGIGDACDLTESRLTEKYPWLPWVGIVSAFAVLIGLFAVTAKTMPHSEKEH